MSGYNALGGLEAIGNVTTPGAGGVFAARGGVIARTGVGTYTLTLDRALNALDACIIASPIGGAADNQVNFAHTSDTVKTLTAMSAAAAADTVAFCVVAMRLSP